MTPTQLAETVPAQTLAKALLEAEECLNKVKERCLFDDDNGEIGVSEDIVIEADLFNNICEAIAQIQRIKKGERV